VLDSLKIEALAHRCAACDKGFVDTHLVLTAYLRHDLRSFERQVELGIIGAQIRNVWVHFDCQKPSAKEWKMTPDIQQCVRCKKHIAATDMVQPVFQVLDPRAVNPNDPSDVGISLNERVYFVHCDCANPGLNKHSSNILITG
jgi:hypothetical protein